MSLCLSPDVDVETVTREKLCNVLRYLLFASGLLELQRARHFLHVWLIPRLPWGADFRV